jgi:hypothetical protein
VFNPNPSLYLHTPVAVFKARVDMALISYPLTSISFDNVTLGAYTDILEDMTVLLGSTEGGDDLGRTRVKGTPGSATLPLPRTSRGTQDGLLDVQDNAYITVLKDYRPWAKIPFFSDNGTGTDYKDGTVEVGDFNTKLPPVANTGPSTAGMVDSGTGLLTVQFPAGGADLSYAMADGATISTYAWDVDGGTITVGTSASAVITATFEPGSYWVSLTVTDSNGKSHTARCFVLAIDTDALNDPRITNYQVQQSLQRQGQTLELVIYENLSRTAYPDGTLVLFWWDEPSSATDRSHIKFFGWLDTESYSIGRSKLGIKRTTTLHASDIGGWLNMLPGFAQALYRSEELDAHGNPISPWSYMPSLDMAKALWYLLFWHSTALGIADYFFPSDLADYDTMRLDGGANTLFQQVADMAQKVVPDHYVAVNSKGQINIQRDWRLDDVADRPAVAVAITESYWNELSVEYNRHPKYHVLRSGAVQVSTDWITVNGEDTLPLIFSVAPGDTAAFGQGPTEQAENEGLAISQTALNLCEGHRWAMLNSYWGSFSFTDPTRSLFWDYEPALFNRVSLSWASTYAPFREIPFTTAYGMIESVQATYTTDKRGSAIKVQVNFTKEESGYPATTHIPDDTEPVGYEPVVVIPPPDSGLTPSQDLVALIGQYDIYRTTDFTTPSGSGGPTWATVNITGSEEILTWAVDPFSPAYVSGSGAVNGFVATADNVYRVSDIFGTVVVNAIVEFATTAQWRTIQASFGTYFSSGLNPWLICVSYYGSAVGHTGTYATYSLDGGVTWADEVLISASYDSGGAINPIGLYCSPKTPGLGYTIAHSATANPATALPYITTDWGATWTQISNSENPSYPLPTFGQFIDTNDTTTTTHAYTELARRPSASISRSSSGTPGATVQYADSLGISPPANAKRITIAGTFQGYHENHGFGATGYSFSFFKNGTFVTRTTISDTNNGLTGDSQDYSRSFVFQYDFSDYVAHDWPDNRDIIEADPSPADSDFAIYFRISIQSNATISYVASASLSLTVTEIVLDDGTTYVPTAPGTIVPLNGMAGEIHLPWENNDAEDVFYSGQLDRTGNRQFALIRAVAGTVDDVSPNDGSKDYGVNAGHFSVRCHDSDRNLVLAAVTGNDASASSSGDKQGVYFSSDAGDTWSAVVAPTTGTVPYQAAFAGSLDGTVLIWGPAQYVSFSDDNGATLDSRAGNLSSLSATKTIGICGGPS